MKPEDFRDEEVPLRAGRIKVNFERPAYIRDTIFAGNEHNIGAFSYANKETIFYDCDIGRYCSIAHRVMIGPVEHPSRWFSSSGFVFNDSVFAFDPAYAAIRSPERFDKNYERTHIGNDVWIGYGAFISRGVTIGDGAIIGAGAIVTKNVEPYMIVGGTPARVLSARFDDSTIERMLKLKWWDYYLDRRVLGDVNYSDVAVAMNAIEVAIGEGKLTRFSPQRGTITPATLGDLQKQVERRAAARLQAREAVSSKPSSVPNTQPHAEFSPSQRARRLGAIGPIVSLIARFVTATAWIWCGLLSAAISFLGFGSGRQASILAFVIGGAIGHLLAAKSISADPDYAVKANVLAMVPAFLLAAATAAAVSDPYD